MPSFFYSDRPAVLPFSLDLFYNKLLLVREGDPIDVHEPLWCALCSFLIHAYNWLCPPDLAVVGFKMLFSFCRLPNYATTTALTQIQSLSNAPIAITGAENWWVFSSGIFTCHACGIGTAHLKKKNNVQKASNLGCGVTGKLLGYGNIAPGHFLLATSWESQPWTLETTMTGAS